MSKQLLVKEKFRQWCARNEKKVIGEANLADSCPIATYLKTKTRKRAVVGILNYKVGREDYRPLPVWAKGFIHRVDITGSQITGKKALELLSY